MSRKSPFGSGIKQAFATKRGGPDWAKGMAKKATKKSKKK